MKTQFIIGSFALAAIILFGVAKSPAAAPQSTLRYEYATIRWDGRDNTHIIRPGGNAERIGHELRKARKPRDTDERAFYMNLAMNGLAKEGYEFVGMTSDEIVMKRRL